MAETDKVRCKRESWKPEFAGPTAKPVSPLIDVAAKAVETLHDIEQAIARQHAFSEQLRAQEFQPQGRGTECRLKQILAEMSMPL